MMLEPPSNVLSLSLFVSLFSSSLLGTPRASCLPYVDSSWNIFDLFSFWSNKCVLCLTQRNRAGYQQRMNTVTMLDRRLAQLQEKYNARVLKKSAAEPPALLALEGPSDVLLIVNVNLGRRVARIGVTRGVCLFDCC